jgi:hypothetical protein
VPLRKLVIEIDLPTHATTGMRAKEEHARILKSILALVEDPGWSAFALNLHDSLGNHAGRATLTPGDEQCVKQTLAAIAHSVRNRSTMAPAMPCERHRSGP